MGDSPSDLMAAGTRNAARLSLDPDSAPAVGSALRVHPLMGKRSDAVFALTPKLDDTREDLASVCQRFLDASCDLVAWCSLMAKQAASGTGADDPRWRDRPPQW